MNSPASARDAYQAFLADKTPVVIPSGLAAMPPLSQHLFPHQADCVSFALRLGRSALFLDTGLGKTLCELEFAHHAAAHTGQPALILAPLAVAGQIVREGQRFNYDARQVRCAAEVRPGINVCNYDRLSDLDPAIFGTVVLDESAILKNFTGKTTRHLIDAFRFTPFRLAATATPAPNDHMELGQHAEFLGVMPSNEMLMRWFIADQTQMGRYRLKGHAVQSFWDWMASWARMASNPADLGYDGAAWNLPPLRVERHRIKHGGDIRKPIGGLFAADVSATTMHAVKRDTAKGRADAVASLVVGNDRPWLVWCDTDYEADALRRAIPDAVEVRGSMTPDRKESALLGFADGTHRVLLTKPSIAGHGMNWQHCADMAFVGRSFSYEAWYQAVRRCWRFGQTRPVTVHLIVAEGEEQIGRVITRKEGDHAAMKEAMAAAQRRARTESARLRRPYNPHHVMECPKWLQSAA